MILSIPYLLTKGDGGFTTPIRIISISILISFLTAYLFWGQSFSQTFKSTFPLMLWFSFFYFTRHQIPLRTIERIIIIYGILYIVLYFFQFLNSEVVYFGWQEEFREERGVVRINFPGGGVFFLFAFLAINKLTNSKKYFGVWLLICFTCIVVVVLQVTRQNIAMLFLLYLYHLFRNISFSKKIGVVAIISVCALVALTVDNPILNGLKEVQKDTSSQGGDYIRILSGTYFLTEFSKNDVTRILGNGVPYYREYDASQYGLYEHILQEELNYFLPDVGFIAFYVMFGLFAILAYIAILYKGLTIDIPKEFNYLKYYLMYVAGTGLTSDSPYSHKFLATNIIAVICYQIIFERKKENDHFVNELSRPQKGTQVLIS